MKFFDFENSMVTNWLFKNKQSSWLWLVVRLYVGWQWFSAGYEKIGDMSWTGSKAGVALGGFLKGALLKTVGTHPDV